MSKRINYSCVSCNKPFSKTVEEVQELQRTGLVPNPFCKECQTKIASKGKKGKELLHQFPTEIRTCINPECVESFQLKSSEIAFYAKHKMPLPKRCPKCRAKRKGNKDNEKS